MKSPTAIILQFAIPLSTLGLAVFLSGCATTHTEKNFGEVTVRPGSSILCTSDPCTTYFETPAGSGTHNILQDGSVKAGVAIGGQRVLLGEYSNESIVFRVEGTDLSPAYLTVIGQPH